MVRPETLRQKIGAIVQMAKTLEKLKFTAKDHLSAGFYRAYPPNLWVRNGHESQLPSHLKRSKGTLGKRKIWKLASVLVSPFLSFFVSTGDKHRTLAVVKSSHALDEFVIFRSDHVFRAMGLPRGEEEIRLRRLWEQWISCSREIPEKSVLDGIAEEFIDLPTSANFAMPHQKREAISLIADAYSALSRNASMGKLSDYRKFIEPKILESAYHDVISRSLRLDALRAFWEQPLVPIGSDNSPENCLFGEKRYAFIDVEPVGLGFAAQHVLGILASWDHGHNQSLLTEFLDGGLDDKLEELLSPKIRLDKTSRFGYVALAVLLPPITSGIRSHEFKWRDSLFEAYGLEEYIS